MFYVQIWQWIRVQLSQFRNLIVPSTFLKLDDQKRTKLYNPNRENSVLQCMLMNSE